MEIFRVALVVLLVFGTTSCTSTSSNQESAELYLQIGTDQLRQGAFPQALSSLLKAERLDSRNPQVQNNLALVYFARERYSLAEKHLREAVRLQPNFTDARNNLGRVLIEMNKVPEAIKELEIAVSDLTYENPQKPFLNLGIAYFRAQKFSQAREYLEKSLSLKKDDCMTLSYLGRNHLELKEFERASRVLDAAIATCKVSLFDEPQYYSALAYVQLGDLARGENRLEELLKLYPNGRYRDRAKLLLEKLRR